MAIHHFCFENWASRIDPSLLSHFYAMSISFMYLGPKPFSDLQSSSRAFESTIKETPSAHQSPFIFSVHCKNRNNEIICSMAEAIVPIRSAKM